MTQETERPLFEAWARSRYPSIDLTRAGDDYLMALAKDYWSLWQSARSVSAVPVIPDFDPVFVKKLADLQKSGYQITGCTIEKKDESGTKGFICADGQQGWIGSGGFGVVNGAYAVSGQGGSGFAYHAANTKKKVV